ncbi:Trafficking protein Mon1 [Novymonas esmeraldas]|uniref:Trafficking protein Mon1 n=1 Tax=Novymonas esmeraldas TaxID=1808958 RepID=A0AAW0ESG2_9TRYP
MSLTHVASAVPATLDSGEVASHDPTEVLWRHARHLLVLTRAGKPVFSLHGDEQGLSPLCALLQVLLHMHDTHEDDDDHDEGGGGGAAARSSAKDELRQVVYYRSACASGEAGHEGDEEAPVQALTLFFSVQGELIYVMSIRSVAAAATGEASSGGGADPGECDAPPVARYCLAQLRHVHACMLLVLPTINALLAKTPALDVMSTYTSADRAALRELVDSYETELTYAVGAVASVALSVQTRQVVEDALLRCYRDCADAAVGPPAHQLFTFLYARDHLVAAVGPPETYAGAASSPPALEPATALCGALHVDDALLLYRYTRSLISRQVGEAWVPVCLPRFNSTGYLWCYAVNLTQHARDLRRQRGLSVWPRVWEAAAGRDVMLLHVSAAQDDFTALSRSTRRCVELLCAPAVGDNFFHRLEEELSGGAPAPLTELLSLARLSPSTACGRTGGVPLWYGLVLDGSGGTTPARPDRPSVAVRHLVESQPSPLLGIATAEDAKALRLLAVRYQAHLRATPVHAAAPSMLLVRHSSDVAVAVVLPTPATLTALARHYFSPQNPFCVPHHCDADAAHGDDVETVATSTRHGVSAAAWVDAVRALGAVELTAVFAAATPEALVWYWVAHVLFVAVRRRDRFLLRQLIGRPQR